MIRDSCRRGRRRELVAAGALAGLLLGAGLLFAPGVFTVAGVAAAAAPSKAAAPPQPPVGRVEKLATDPTYEALRAARPDGRTVAVHGFAFERDAFHIEFQSGTVHFLAPVAGRTIGAVFLGQGTLRLKPASAAERRQLQLNLGAGADFEVLNDSFDQMVLLFGDDTDAEISQAGPIEQHAPDAQARQVYERWLERQRRDFHRNLQVRLLRHLLNHPGLTSGVFLALVQGKTLPPALLAVDPDGAGQLLGVGRFGREHTLLDVVDPHSTGIWYLSDSAAEIASGRRPPVAAAARALHYWVATTVGRSTDLAGLTTIELRVLAPGLRVLPIDLMPKLRIASASYGELPAAAAAAPGADTADHPAEPAEPVVIKNVAVVQEDANGDGGDAAVIFPEPLAKGALVQLRIAYQGDGVLRDAGEKNYYVTSRERWYPNIGTFEDPALYDLVYRVPAGNQVVSVGHKVSDQTAGDQDVSAWTTGPVRVAGFNYGKFKSVERRDETSGIDVQVFTNPGTPDALRELNRMMASSGNRELARMGNDDPGIYNAAPQATLGNISTGRLAESALADGINSARVYYAYFGPPAVKQVAITQQSEASSGQSWPSLIFMPYLSFLDGTQRQRIGLGNRGMVDFVDRVGYHEFAHQWWGHLVAAASYRDVWLEEGFAEFSSALAIQHAEGWPAYDHAWSEARKQIFATRPHNAVAPIDAGPITQGFRLITERTPSAYQPLVYEKGAYVLHMLRMLQWDSASPAPDHRFIEMMHDYASSFANQQATTADFQKVVERHMAPTMNATGNGKMDWFFKQWVYGTAVPRLTADLHLQPAGDQVHITGKVTQAEVPADFRSLVPLYLNLDKGEVVRVGLLPMVGSVTVPVDVTVKSPKPARGVSINAHSEVLARE